MIRQAAGLLTLAVSVSFFGACTRVSRPVTAASDGHAAAPTVASEEAIKTSGQSLLAEGTETLKIERQTEYELGGDGPFVYPVSLATDDSGVYISDNNAHAIRFRAPHSESVTTLPTLDTAKLVWPNTIQISKGSAFVSDNEGIKAFGLDGRFQRVLKTYYAINDFTIGMNRKIYVNPSFRTHKASNPLIIEVDSDGARVKGFGERLNHSNYGYLDDLAYLCTAGNSILAVFKHRPVVHVYNSEGKFLREFTVKHPVFESLAALTGDVGFTHPGPSRYRLPTYVSGARVVGNRLMVLLDLPQPEIVEMSLMGEELGRYQGKVPFTTMGYRGFDVQLSGSTYRFWLLAANVKKLAFMEFTGTRKTHDSQARTYSN